MRSSKPVAIEFFAGSGLVSEALRPFFRVVWANDNCEKKAAIYTANHGTRAFHLADIETLTGETLPPARLAWASFPCQDLSLAGAIDGIRGKRSGLVWEWLRVIDEMAAPPPILVAENVLGLVSAHGGANYRAFHAALTKRGYRVGAVTLDAVRWLPQSRPRVFVVAVSDAIAIPPSLIAEGPGWPHHPAIVRAAAGLRDWIWWRLPEPESRRDSLTDVIEWDAACHDRAVARRNVALVPRRHRVRLEQEGAAVAPGYKRIRNGAQVLELRFDGVAGCLRTARGGSSRQFLVLRRNGSLATRLLTVREAARLMGAPAGYQIPGSYNDGYNAMGDAVAVPVARFLAERLLAPLASKM
ncbi:MAG TPA: DNA cytosine methyltransferase [Terriglobia bacterium]|nr:DNA cytosine methyltransferase [Terriglobia bacterium]